MRGTVKWFDSKNKGYGFITDSDGKDHFVHHSSIQMKSKFRFLNEGDIVEFDTGKGTNDREQAVNVTPILTRKMVEKALKKEKLCLKTTKNALGYRAFMVVDEDNVIQAGEQGMSLEEILNWLNDGKELLEDSVKYPCN